MAERDGNGWVRCAQGHRHWGRFGAAGLLAYVPGNDGMVTVLLQRRSSWGNHPGTWGPPGGARDSHESAVAAALREAAEAAWIPADEVGRLALHPGFAAQWPALRAALFELTVIVDVANVMGSRADGWWRDRAGAAARLHGELAALAARGVAALPGSLAAPVLERWFPCFVLVLEGAARPALSRQPATRQVRVVAADGSGDDLIADLAARIPGQRLVVTADRELRSRCTAAGASVTGPRWLLGML